MLDWGGSGEAMVLLTGGGDNAHVYDQFAFQFTYYFHVIGITRRGYLPSSQPENGYDVPTRAADDIAVLYLGTMVAQVKRADVNSNQVVELITSGRRGDTGPTVQDVPKVEGEQ